MPVPKYGKNYQGELEGWIYVPYEDRYYRDPVYWMKFYQDRGIIPKQKSSSEMLLDQLTNLGILKGGELVLDEILGLGLDKAQGGESGGLLGQLLDKITDSLFGSSTTGSSTTTEASQGLIGGLIDKVGSLFSDIGGSLFGSSTNTSSQGLLGGLLDKIGNAFSNIGGALFGSGQAASSVPMSIGGVDDLMSYLGISNAASQAPMTIDPRFAGTSAAGSALSSYAIPVVSAGISGYSAYKAGKPTPGGFIAGAAMLPFNPVAGILTIGANLLGGIFGGRKKKKKIDKWARKTAKYLVEATGIEDEDILFHYLRGNYKRLKDDMLAKLNKDAYLSTIGDLRKKVEEFYKTKNLTPDWAKIEPELKRMALDTLFFGAPKIKRFQAFAPSRDILRELLSYFKVPIPTDPFMSLMLGNRNALRA